MKQLLFTLVFIGTVFLCSAQRLEKAEVWPLLYPENKNFDASDRLIRKVNRDGETIKLRSEIQKLFYYSSGGTRKALVVFFSYRFNEDTGENEDCNLCAPEFDLAYLSYQNNTWTKTKFIKNWKGSNGSKGEGGSVELETYKNKLCLVVSASFFARGTFSSVTSYYEIENLTLVETIESEE